MQLDFQRYEYKYAIPDTLRPAIREFIATYTRPDAYTAKQGHYVIHSLYLDSPGLTFHLAKQRKQLNRVKLRIRAYGNPYDSPVFFEIKRKVKRVVHKQRILADPDWAEAMMMGHSILPHQASSRDQKVFGEFSYLQHHHQARPAVLVRYNREAYESQIDTYGRVTFDRLLLCRKPQGYSWHAQEEGWMAIDDPVSTSFSSSATILELKFSGRAPRWMADLVQRFDLQLRGFSKYSTSIERSLFRYRHPDPRIAVLPPYYPA